MIELFLAEWPKGKTYTEKELTHIFLGIGSADPRAYDEESDEFDKTRRRVREYIRVLRTEYAFPLVASTEGYWIVRTKDEAAEYVQRFGATSWSSIRSRVETYDALRATLGAGHDLFQHVKEDLAALDTEHGFSAMRLEPDEEE